MRIKYLKIEKFKNLNNFELNLRDNTNDILLTVGKNGTGKSNLLEAMVLIFRNLLLFEKKTIKDIIKQTTSVSKPNLFNFMIEYECNGFDIRVEFKKIIKNAPSLFLTITEEASDDIDNEYIFHVKESTHYKKIHKSDFFVKLDTNNQYKYLPAYVFAYYSGISNRLEEHFDYHQNSFYNDLLKGNEEAFRPLFYARSIHSNFVLLAFYAFEDEEISSLLKDKLNIVALESVLFVIRKPIWKSKVGDKRFWYAKGVVANFLSDLFEKSFLPIKGKVDVRIDFRHSEEKDCWYLFLENQDKLKELAKKYNDRVDFFKALESTYISDLIHETRVRVKRKDSDDPIIFKELSEGEQQLLTVLGLLKFTNHAESLFFLDEPDTHLSPIWGQDYLKILKSVSGSYEKSQMFISTHKSTTVSGLSKEQILVFSFDENGKTIWNHPDIDAKGLTSDGVLTQIFEMEYTYDEGTWNEMLDRRKLFAKKQFDTGNFTEDDADQLAKLTNKLSDYAGDYADVCFMNLCLN